MLDQDTIEPEYIEKKKEMDKIINDNKIKIVLNEDEIRFIIMIGISFYQYVKEYKYEDIKKELNFKDIENIYEYLMKSEYEIIEEDKKLIINKKEIKLDEKELTDNEMIKILIEEIKEIKNENKKEFEKLNILNKEKDNKIKILENECKELKEKINDLEESIIYKDEINLVYNTEKEGECKIFGDKFVEINENNIDLNINGKIQN